jgi:hypothetical protein
MESILYHLEDGTHARVLKTAAAEGAVVQRLPTHFILLMDTSDSMSDNNKLANVKHSASLVLNFLGPQDRLSLVTFGDDADTYAKAVACSSEQKEALKAKMEHIRTDGCTNLSAGVLAVRDILSQRTAEVAALKTGILLLTDGHANRGVSRADLLGGMLRQLHEEYPDISLQVVGYGTDHNGELLKTVAEQTAGTYSVVDDREGAATVIGDSLGSLFSCVAQRVSMNCESKITLEGAQFKLFDDPPRVQIGDLYEDSETVVLFRATGTITVTGTLLPSMESFNHRIAITDAVTEVPAQLRETVELTRCRYRISALFKDLREFRYGSSRFREILEKVEAEETLLKEARYTDNPTAKMLLAECASLREGTAILQTGTRGDIAEMTTRLVSHEAYTNLARGTTQAIQQPQRGRANSYGFDSDAEEGDPTLCAASIRANRVRFPPMGINASASPAVGAGLQATALEYRDPGLHPTSSASGMYMTSPYAARTARRVTQLMATMSQGGEEAAAAAHEAAALSQMGPQAENP